MVHKGKGIIRKVIGINTGHNGGCALCIDGKIRIAISEERLTRVKNTPGWLNALKYCLENSGLKLSDIDLVVFSSYRDRLPGKGFDGGLNSFGFPKNRCISVDHHLSHACSTFLTSPFQESVIFVYDSHGNGEDTESFYLGNGSTIKKNGGNPLPDPKKGIVRAYESFTSYFGWTSDEAGKTMGLAPYGDKSKFRKYPVYSQDKEGWFYSNLEDYYSNGVEKLCHRYSLKIPAKFLADKFTNYRNMASWIQGEFERAVVGTVSKLISLTGLSNLCLAGGGALNGVCNRKILQQSGVKNLFIFPAANDAGECIGNALYGYYIYGRNSRRKYIWHDDYLGKTYTPKDILQRLENKRGFRDNTIKNAPDYSFRHINNITQITANLLAKGKIIGWFQGGSELGPRALGHRSILSDPRRKNMKEFLNLKVKGRESFRPFAASVLEEKSKDYFDLNIPSPFMLLVASVKKDKVNEIPAVTHIDGTSRIQTVNSWEGGIFYKLIKNFYKITGVPLVLNTSFNLSGEPIVETPTDAMRCFLRTGMDYLVINDILIKK